MDFRVRLIIPLECTRPLPERARMKRNLPIWIFWGNYLKFSLTWNDGIVKASMIM